MGGLVTEKQVDRVEHRWSETLDVGPQGAPAAVCFRGEAAPGSASTALAVFVDHLGGWGEGAGERSISSFYLLTVVITR